MKRYTFHLDFHVKFDDSVKFLKLKDSSYDSILASLMTSYIHGKTAIFAKAPKEQIESKKVISQ